MSDWKARAVPVTAEATEGGWKSRATPVSAPAEQPKEDPLAQYPGTAFGLGSLNKLAMGGGSAALALKDMLSMRDSATGENDKSGRSAKDLYLANKAFYDQGFERLGKANPKADFASNAAYFVGPGGPAKAGVTGLLKRGAVQGAGHAALGGSESFADDPEAAAKETVAGGAIGAGASLVGMVPGKLLEAGGKMARKGLSKVMGRVNSEAIESHGAEVKELNSQIGKRREQGKDANAALDRLLELEHRVQQGAGPTLPMPGSGAPTRAARRLGLDPGRVKNRLDAREKLARRDFDDFFDNPKQITAKVRPMSKHIAEATERAREKATGAVKDIAIAGALGLGGGEAAEKLGLDKKWGYAIGGAAPLWFLRNAAQKVAKHPDSLKRLTGLRGVGQKLSIIGARGGSTAGTDVALAVMAKNDPEVERVLAEEYVKLEKVGGYEPAQDEPDGLTYRKRSPVDPARKEPDDR